VIYGAPGGGGGRRSMESSADHRGGISSATRVILNQAKSARLSGARIQPRLMSAGRNIEIHPLSLSPKLAATFPAPASRYNWTIIVFMPGLHRCAGNVYVYALLFDVRAALIVRDRMKPNYAEWRYSARRASHFVAFGFRSRVLRHG